MVKAQGKWEIAAVESANSALNWLQQNMSVWYNLQLSYTMVLKIEMQTQIMYGVCNLLTTPNSSLLIELLLKIKMNLPYDILRPTLKKIILIFKTKKWSKIPVSWDKLCTKYAFWIFFVIFLCNFSCNPPVQCEIEERIQKGKILN